MKPTDDRFQKPAPFRPHPMGPRLFRVECPRCGEPFQLAYRPEEIPICPDCFYLRHQHSVSRGFNLGRQEPKRTLKAIRVKCTSCGQSDDIPFHIQNPEKVLCNACHDKLQGHWRMHRMESPWTNEERLAVKFPCALCEMPGYIYAPTENDAREIIEAEPTLYCKPCLKIRYRQEGDAKRENLLNTRKESGGKVVVRRRKSEPDSDQ